MDTDWQQGENHNSLMQKKEDDENQSCSQEWTSRCRSEAGGQSERSKSLKKSASALESTVKTV